MHQVLCISRTYLPVNLMDVPGTFYGQIPDTHDGCIEFYHSVIIIEARKKLVICAVQYIPSFPHVNAQIQKLAQRYYISDSENEQNLTIVNNCRGTFNLQLNSMQISVLRLPSQSPLSASLIGLSKWQWQNLNKVCRQNQMSTCPVLFWCSVPEQIATRVERS